ncbi:endoplasmic reticulum membrane sensor NFE2L1a isoform X2 [Echeneis naucrates]|uniref:endoplasmic reticulum membrane sensor NFE2L1a isoform X2 n=1 Tax=Echeneis naucrates TaxID=173247 RepID=UPI001113EF6B|nr:endoplasmic reticulum membrane sensor NFE2L1-like isoform X2 [Echeneis naucrates]
MLYQKKYFTEGLIQMAILLSLCGVKVDVGLESYLSRSWHEMILGPTSALTQTQFHNLRNRLEDGNGLHPKNMDLDGFFMARRLLDWVRSLDRVQVPHAELETWFVQTETDPLPMEGPAQPSLLERAPVDLERDQSAPSVESRAVLDNEEATPGSGALDASGEEEEDEEARMHRNYWRTEGGGRPRGSYGHGNEDLTQNEEEEQECLRLLAETFPLTEEQQLNAFSRRGDVVCHPPDREPMLLPILPADNPSVDFELQWQDLLSIMEPEQGIFPFQNTVVDMMTSFDHTQEIQGTALQNDVLSQSSVEPGLLPLIPSAELEDDNSAFNTRDTFRNSNVNGLHNALDQMDLLGEDLADDFNMVEDADDSFSTFNMLAQENMESSQDLQYDRRTGDLASFDVNFHLGGLTPFSSATSLEDGGRNNMSPQSLRSPATEFLVDEEDLGDEDGVPIQIGDLLEDTAILDEMRLLDIVLEEGFSPEMTARLEEEGYLACDTRKDDDHSISALTEDESQPRLLQQGGEEEADSDSGLSLDFSHSPASPCASEASYYSSSSSSSSYSSSSCASAVENLFYVKDNDAEGGGHSSLKEVEVAIKQEELEEEEMGAVGGVFPEDVKKYLPVTSGGHKVLNGFPWLEHIDHDHTYNQPWSSTASPSLNKIPIKHTKSPRQHHSPRHYRCSSSRHISDTKMWSRDERRARAMKIPFTNELIVNLPVEEFNDLLTSCQLSEEQLTLIRDIRRRGKNKIAAQNCRKRKMNVLLGLDDEVSGLRRHHSRLLREKQDALRNLQEMKRRLNVLHEEVFSRLRDEDGRPLDAREYLLYFGDNDSVAVVSHEHEAWLTRTGEKTSKKQRNKKK